MRDVLGFRIKFAEEKHYETAKEISLLAGFLALLEIKFEWTVYSEISEWTATLKVDKTLKYHYI